VKLLRAKSERAALGGAAEYRKHARECRKLAHLTAVPADQQAFEEIARSWEMLAILSARAIDAKDD
jgi:hypothetical protein